MPTENLTHATHSNDLGDCSESKATKAAHDNPSPITGYDTVWRGKGENPHKFTGENVGNPTNGTHEQMNPCDTCADSHNIEEYMNYANGQNR